MAERVEDDPETGAIAELYALLARCFEHPDEQFRDALDAGEFERQLAERLDDIDVTPPPMPDVGEELTEQYLRTFEAYEDEYAPLAESPYRDWWDDTDRELLAGPPAHDMRRRYDAIDATVPDAYPADHLALLLEYGSLLLEEGDVDAYRAFHDDHFGWLDAFENRVDRTVDSAFYEWAVSVLLEVLEAVEHSEVGPESRPVSS